MKSSSYYIDICIESLQELAIEGDLEAMVILIEEDIDKSKWLDRIAEMVKKGHTLDLTGEQQEIINAERRRAASKLLKLAKKISDIKNISAESLMKARNIK